LATDDDRIENAARKLGVPVVMTRPDHASGTDRVFEAAQLLSWPSEGVVVNIQGDEPALEPAMLRDLITPFQHSAAQVTTLARMIPAADAQNPDLVKVVLDARGWALYFSRSVIPFVRGKHPPVHWGHIGIYGFRMSTLARFVTLEIGELERIEKLEQLRLLEHGIPIQVVPTRYVSHGVDRPEDIAKVIPLLRSV
jgi:3-deoxy-manno-octulosonate cytidylyltransferase (CMP-KDO synthetase)